MTGYNQTLMTQNNIPGKVDIMETWFLSYNSTTKSYTAEIVADGWNYHGPSAEDYSITGTEGPPPENTAFDASLMFRVSLQ